MNDLELHWLAGLLPSWKFVAKGEPAVHLMLRLRPLMGERRQQQIDRALGVLAPENQLNLMVGVASTVSGAGVAIPAVKGQAGSTPVAHPLP